MKFTLEYFNSEGELEILHLDPKTEQVHSSVSEFSSGSYIEPSHNQIYFCIEKETQDVDEEHFMTWYQKVGGVTLEEGSACDFMRELIDENKLLGFVSDLIEHYKETISEVK